MDEPEDLEALGLAAHGPPPTEAQRAAVAGWETLLAREYAPRPLLRVPAHPVARARYPVIDVHKHLGYWPREDRLLRQDRRRTGGWPGPVEALVEGMDALNVRACVNLDGFSGPTLRRVLDRYAPHADRFLTFAGASWHRTAEPDFGEREGRELARSVAAGARGFKVFKGLGLWLRDPAGALLMPDDPRLDPLWGAAGELGIPVLIHVADPEGFFRPPDRHNDRLPGLFRRPEWYFGGEGHPPFEELMERQARLFRRHPRTVFFGAHVLNRPDDLAWVGQVLEACPNVYAEISARIADLGRQPRMARAFFERYQDRVLFGTDGSDLGLYPHYFRVLETEDDLIVPQRPGGPQGPEGPQGDEGAVRAGAWPLYGLGLPDGVLRKLYRGNAAAVFGLS
jgi:predicted TIM-barrel fold metal-dependent hydrolase